MRTRARRRASQINWKVHDLHSLRANGLADVRLVILILRAGISLRAILPILLLFREA